MRGTWSAVGAFLFLAMAAPGVAAQDQLGPNLTLVVEPPTEPVKPEVESPFLILVVTARCDAVLARAPAAAPEDVPVTVTFTVANGVVITGPSQVGIDPQLCLAPATTEVTVMQPYQVTVPRTAPGLQATPGTVKAQFVFDVGPGLPTTPTNPLNFVINVDYFSVSQVKVPSKLKQCQDGRAAFDLEVTNFGNARTQYTFELAGEPGGNEWNAQVPEVLLLDSPNSGLGSPTSTVTFHVACASGNKEGAYHLVIRPSASDDPTKEGNPINAHMLARARPFDGAVPVPGPLGPVAALGLLGLAILARRRA